MHALIYSDDLKVKDALQLYFSKNHFTDGGYHLKWFKIKLGRIYIPLPNFKSRVEAVKIHDIHHLITEYDTSFKGESEIGAWEIATGCEKYSAAWLLNYGSFSIGMILFPRNVLSAFLRGRRCATNLYFQTKYDEILLNKTVGELRKKINIDASINNSVKDYFVFSGWCLAALSYYLVGISIIYLAYSICNRLV
jgi:hypothetical protein